MLTETQVLDLIHACSVDIWASGPWICGTDCRKWAVTPKNLRIVAMPPIRACMDGLRVRH